MMYKDLYDWLAITKKANPTSIKAVRDYERKNKCSTLAAIENLKLCSIEEIENIVKSMYRLDTYVKEVPTIATIKEIQIDEMLKNGFIAFYEDMQQANIPTSVRVKLNVSIIVYDPSKQMLVRDIIKNAGVQNPIHFYWMSENKFRAWARERKVGENSVLDRMKQTAQDNPVELNRVDTVTDIQTDANGEQYDAAIINITESFMKEAIELNASDMHIEPTPDGCIIRYRIDGVLIPYHEIKGNEKVRRIVNRYKGEGAMDINNSLNPQSGKIQFNVDGMSMDIRVSSLPAIYGEKIVLRFLNNGGGKIRTLSELGVPEKSITTLRRMYNRPYGIVLVSGPTGSGKSSTLAAVLSELNTPDVCVITIENPVEYKIPGAVQVNVNEDSGLTFPVVLREVLRQDPNIIMVGEIRDKETADIAMQAANTGHMVFSTIHTNSASSAIGRLRDMGVDGYLVADNIVGIVSQALVRKLCPHCKKEHVIDESDVDAYDLPANMLGKHIYEPVGCPRCNKSGYLGRTIVFEALEMTPPVVQAIHERKHNQEVEAIAAADGFVKKIFFAYNLIEKGITSLPEVYRVIGGTRFEKVDN